MLDFIVNNYIEIVEALLAILGGFSILAKYTPTDADDKVLAAVVKFIHAFGLTKK